MAPVPRQQKHSPADTTPCQLGGGDEEFLVHPNPPPRVPVEFHVVHFLAAWALGMMGLLGQTVIVLRSEFMMGKKLSKPV